MEPATHTPPKPKKAPLTPQQRIKRRRGILLRLAAYGGLWIGISFAVAWTSVSPMHLRQHWASPKWLKMEYKSVKFHSKDGTLLSGWQIPALPTKSRHASVILCHGVDSNRTSLLPQARLLHNAGYDVVMFDFRARGESEGSRCTLGFHETEDLLAAVDFVKSEPNIGSQPIGVLGQSEGAAVSLMAASRTPALRAICAESPYASLDHAVANNFHNVLGPFGPVLGVPVRFFGERLIQADCSTISPLAAIPALRDRPVLLIQDEADTLCPPEETVALMKASAGSAQLWKVPGAGHIQASMLQPAAYDQHVLQFFNESLKPAGTARGTSK